MKNVKTPKQRIFFRHSALYFFAGLTPAKDGNEVHPCFDRRTSPIFSCFDTYPFP